MKKPIKKFECEVLNIQKVEIAHTREIRVFVIIASVAVTEKSQGLQLELDISSRKRKEN